MKIPHTQPGWHRVRAAAQSGQLAYRQQSLNGGDVDSAAASSAGRPREGGMVTVLFIALLAIMMVFVLVESQALIRLRREVKLLEQQQLKRLNASQTNTVSTVTIP